MKNIHTFRKEIRYSAVNKPHYIFPLKRASTVDTNTFGDTVASGTNENEH